MGCLDPDEDPSRRAARACVPEIADQSLADLPRQREAILLRPFTPHCDLTGTPIDILQFQRHDLTGTKTQASQEKQDGIVASTRGVGPIAGLQELLDLIRGERLRQRRQVPIRHCQNATRQVSPDFPSKSEEAKERSECSNHDLDVPVTPVAGAPENESGDVVGAQMMEPDRPSPKTLRQEASNERKVVDLRSPREPAFLREVLGESAFDRTRRLSSRLGWFRRNRSHANQMIQEQPEAEPVPWANVELSAPIMEELVSGSSVEATYSEATSAEPSAKIRDQSNLVLRRIPGIAALLEKGSKTIDERTQGSFMHPPHRGGEREQRGRHRSPFRPLAKKGEKSRTMPSESRENRPQRPQLARNLPLLNIAGRSA
jgi:hypothetical protein